MLVRNRISSVLLVMASMASLVCCSAVYGQKFDLEQVEGKILDLDLDLDVGVTPELGTLLPSSPCFELRFIPGSILSPLAPKLDPTFEWVQVDPDVVYADNTGDAVGINNIVLDGECLDIRFSRGSYNETYASQHPRYLGQELQANQATNRIMDVMNAEPTTPDINDSNNEVLWIPTDRTRTTFEAEQVGHDLSSAPWRRFGDFSGSRATAYDAWDFAVFGSSLDCNNDGVVDVQDMNCSCSSGLGDEVLDAIDSYAGDLDGNGRVGFSDFLKLSENFGEAGQYTDGDIDCDGMVTFGDFLVLSDNYGKGRFIIPDFNISPVPEPNSALIALGFIPAMGLIRRRRR